MALRGTPSSGRQPWRIRRMHQLCSSSGVSSALAESPEPAASAPESERAAATCGAFGLSLDLAESESNQSKDPAAGSSAGLMAEAQASGTKGAGIVAGKRRKEEAAENAGAGRRRGADGMLDVTGWRQGRRRVRGGRRPTAGRAR